MNAAVHRGDKKEKQMKKVSTGALIGALVLMASWQLLPIAAEAG